MNLWYKKIAQEERNLPAVGAPMMAATPWNSIINPKPLVNLSNPIRSTVITDLRELNAAARKVQCNNINISI